MGVKYIMDTQTMNIIAVVSGPIIAVLITLWYHSHKQKQDAKRQLFFTLMAHRKSSPPTTDWVDSLNLIDVIFSSHPKVVTLWHEYYLILHQKPFDFETSEYKYLDLLLAMARCLGYRNILQTDIDKFYSPQAHGDQAILSTRIQQEFLRVLENTQSLEGLQSQNKQNIKNQ